MILLDTQMWVYQNLGSDRLPRTVRDAIRRGDAVLSVISVWEVLLAVGRGRIHSDVSPIRTVELWLERYPFAIVELRYDDVVLSRTLPFIHEDPADRFIAATAHRLGAELATDDAKLLGLEWLRTIGA